MIPSSVCLLLLLAPPSPTPRCAPDDLACTAEDSVREADSTKDARVRAEALLTAARAYLLLYRRTGHRAHVCRAERLLGRLPRAQPRELDEFLRGLRAELADEQARLGFDCKSDRPRPKSPAVARRPNLSQTATSTSPTALPAVDQGDALAGASSSVARRPSQPQTARSAPPTALPTDKLADSIAAVSVAGHLAPESEDRVLLEIDPGKTDGAPETAALALTSTSSPKARATPLAPELRSSSRPPGKRPGRGLLIGGGVALTSASLFGALAVGAMIRRDQILREHDALASNANHDGYTSPDDDMARRELAPEVTRWHRVMVGASISSGILAGAAVALISTGVAKRRHLSERLAVRPALAGILLSARF